MKHMDKEDEQEENKCKNKALDNVEKGHLRSAPPKKKSWPK